MLHPSTKRLIDKLSEMTRKQRVAWAEGENGTITHDTEGYRVVLTPEPHTVLLTDALGKEIESCTPDEFADDTDSTGRPYAAFVADLYREASRHARGTERAISTLLKGLETMDEAPAAAPDPAHDPDDLIEDLGDETGAYPEFEGQTDMARAVASMADELNGGPAAPESDDEPEADESEIELAAEAELAGTGMDTGEPEAGTPEPEAGTGADTAPYSESYAEPEPDDTASPLWPADEKDVHTGTAVEDTEPDASPLTPSEDVQRPIPASGGGFFGSSLGNLSQYRPEPAPETAEPEPETGETPEEASDTADTAGPDTRYSAAPDGEDAPATETAPDPAPAPAAPRHFSLSGISSGFGLGSAGRVGTPPDEPAAPPPDVPAGDRPRVVIDGTVDLPDEAILDDFDADPDAPAYPEPLTDKPEDDFRFSEAAAATEAHDPPPAAAPEEQAFEAPAATEEPEAPAQPDEDDTPEPEPAPKVTTRFNPWN